MKSNIIKLEEKLRLAMLTGNIPVLEELIADSLIFTAPTGDIINKQMDLEVHRSGVQKISKLEPSDQNIKIYDNFAVITVKMLLEGTFNDNSINGTYCYTRIWANLQNRWQVVAGHVSQIADI